MQREVVSCVSRRFACCLSQVCTRSGDQRWLKVVFCILGFTASEIPSRMELALCCFPAKLQVQRYSSSCYTTNQDSSLKETLLPISVLCCGPRNIKFWTINSVSSTKVTRWETVSDSWKRLSNRRTVLLYLPPNLRNYYSCLPSFCSPKTLHDIPFAGRGGILITVTGSHWTHWFIQSWKSL